MSTTRDLDEHTSATVGWPVLLVLASLAALSPVSTDLYLPGFPAMGTALDAGASEVQLSLTAFLAGLAVGQLLMGPLSDRYGRRRPLLVSATVCVLAAVACALAPNLGVLVAARVVQGIAGAGGMVIGRAVLADLVTGRAAARAFTLMLTVGGVAPVLAPVAGGLLVGPVGWRGLLWTVALLCAVALAAVVGALPETRPPAARTSGGTSYGDSLRLVARTPGFWPPVAVAAASFATLMAYISSSPFVYQRVVGLSALGYGIAFGTNAVGLIGSGWVAGRVVERVEPATLVRWCMTVQLAATSAFVVLALVGAPAWSLCVPIFVAVATNGGVMGSAAALAMARVRAVAGTGSAVLGFSQFVVGALVSPLVGLGGTGSALVPAVVMATGAAVGRLASTRLVSPARPRGRSPRRGAGAGATPRPGPSPAAGASAPPR